MVGIPRYIVRRRFAPNDRHFRTRAKRSVAHSSLRRSTGTGRGSRPRPVPRASRSRSPPCATKPERPPAETTAQQGARGHESLWRSLAFAEGCRAIMLSFRQGMGCRASCCLRSLPSGTIKRGVSRRNIDACRCLQRTVLRHRRGSPQRGREVRALGVRASVPARAAAGPGAGCPMNARDQCRNGFVCATAALALGLAASGCDISVGPKDPSSDRTTGHEDYGVQTGSGDRGTRAGPDRRPGRSLPPIPRGANRLRPAPEAPRVRTRKAQMREDQRVKRTLRLPHTAKDGCQQAVAPRPGSRGFRGPPAPRATARLAGKQVIVNFEFDTMPSSPACRPFLVALVALAHDRSHRHHETAKRIVVAGRRGSATVALPPQETGPPYYVRVRALARDMRPSRETKIRLGD